MSTSTSSLNSSIFPSPTATIPANNQSPPQSSSLYLFTFLATLLLLLAVSCAIVIRSFILRRRFRRRLEAAIAAGMIIPVDDGPGGRGMGMGRGRRRDFGEKPRLWEVWVDEHGHVHDNAERSSEGDNFGKSEGKWEEILPVSATIVSSNVPRPIPLPGNGSAISLPASEHQDARRRFISRFFGRHPPPLASSPPPAQVPPREQSESPSQLELTCPPSDAPKDPETNDEKLQVSVLISMPNPNSRKLHGSDTGGTGSDTSVKGKGRCPGSEDPDGETEIPDVVFGVAEVGFRSC